MFSSEAWQIVHLKSNNCNAGNHIYNQLRTIMVTFIVKETQATSRLVSFFSFKFSDEYSSPFHFLFNSWGHSSIPTHEVCIWAIKHTTVYPQCTHPVHHSLLSFAAIDTGTIIHIGADILSYSEQICISRQLLTSSSPPLSFLHECFPYQMFGHRFRSYIG